MTFDLRGIRSIRAPHARWPGDGRGAILPRRRLPIGNEIAPPAAARAGFAQ
ncbi:MAG TPA: hypothetical protein VFQ39_06520 [Longimicrobium sp.]|nr:hypothetical protein [Longimicrobium sp.]